MKYYPTALLLIVFTSALFCQQMTREEYATLEAEYIAIQNEIFRAETMKQTEVERLAADKARLEGVLQASQREAETLSSQLEGERSLLAEWKSENEVLAGKLHQLCHGSMEELQAILKSRNDELDASARMGVQRLLLSELDGVEREYQVISVGVSARWVFNEATGIAAVGRRDGESGDWSYRLVGSEIVAPMKDVYSALSGREIPQVWRLPL